MISHEEIESRLKAIEGVAHAFVTGDGHHYHLTVVSDAFAGLKALARQQWVYKQLKDWIVSGQLHALHMKTWTMAEWEKQHG